MATATDTKPDKPYPEFPLFAHGNGQWAKKIKGKQWCFGVWNQPDAALRKYLDELDEIQAGRDPRKTNAVQVSSNELTVYDLTNLFLERQESRVAAGDVSQRHFSDCFKSCKTLNAHFGKFMRAASLRAADFKNLRASFPATWGTAKVGNEIQRIRSVFKWAAESEMIQTLLNFGPDFKKPSRTVSRRDQQQRQADRGGNWTFHRTRFARCSRRRQAGCMPVFCSGSTAEWAIPIAADCRPRFWI